MLPSTSGSALHGSPPRWGCAGVSPPAAPDAASTRVRLPGTHAEDGALSCLHSTRAPRALASAVTAKAYFLPLIPLAQAISDAKVAMPAEPACRPVHAESAQTLQVTALRRGSDRTGIRLRTRAVQNRSGNGSSDDPGMRGDAPEQEYLVRISSSCAPYLRTSASPN